MTHYDKEAVLDRAVRMAPVKVSRIGLGVFDTAYSPTSTKWDWKGPGVVQYAFHDDGGISVRTTGAITKTEKVDK